MAQPEHPQQTLPKARPGVRLARLILIDLAIMTVIGVVLGLIGPFGSAAVSLPVRLVTWIAFCYLGYACFRPFWWVVDRLHQSLQLPVAGLWVAACLIASIPLAIAIWFIEFLPGPVPVPSPEGAFATYFNTLVIGASITAVFHLIERKPAPEKAAEPATIDAPREAGKLESPRFLDRLPPGLGTDLIALEMEDHYVRAHTAMGSDLVLIRMRDAVAELDGMDGAQVHRSWWVARHAVRTVRREGRNLRLELANGIEAPVSRSNAPELKRLGWI